MLVYTDAGRICRPLFIVDHVSSSSSSEEENESVAEKEVTTDVKEDCTIFVRNIPFDAYRLEGDSYHKEMTTARLQIISSCIDKRWKGPR